MPKNNFETSTGGLTKYQVFPFLITLYMSIMLTSGLLSDKIIIVMGHITMAGTLVVPLLFIISDIIAEVYGYTIAKRIILWAFISQIIFAGLCTISVHFPSPTNIPHQDTYNYVISSQLRIAGSGFLAYIVSGWLNVYIITKWKFLLKGRYFWLRSIGSSTIAEGIFTVLAVFMIQLGKLPVHDIFAIIVTSYSIKLISSLVAAFPASITVNFIKLIDKTDVYDNLAPFNPFFAANTGKSYE